MARTKKHRKRKHHHQVKHNKKTTHKLVKRHPNNLLILPNKTPANINEISMEINREQKKVLNEVDHIVQQLTKNWSH